MKEKKHILPLATLALVLSMGIVACGGGKGGEESKPAGGDTSQTVQEKITISAAEGKTKLIFGEKVQLTASVEGVTWASSKPEVATVDANGLVTSVGKGSTQIKASKEGYKDGSLSISVDFETIKVTATGETTLLAGQTVQLSADKDGVSWSSSDESIATVDATGKVTAVKVGSATIKASKTNFNDGSIDVNVVRPDPTAVLHFEDAAHFAADGWWATSYSGTDYGPGDSPIYERSSGNASDGTCIAYMVAGDKETLTFTSDKAVKAELVVTMASRTEVADMSTVMEVKFNEAAIDLAGQSFAGGGDTNTFLEFSLGEFDLVNGNNVLEFNFLASSPYFDDLNIYAASSATIAIVSSGEAEKIALTTPAPDEEGNYATVELTVEDTLQLASSITGLSYASTNEAIVTVSETGLLTAVAKGSAKVTIFKQGMKSIRLNVSVSAKVDAGSIMVEVENGTSEGDVVTFRRPSSGSPSGQATNAFPVDAVLEIKFTASAAGEMMLKLAARAPTSAYNTGEDYPLDGVMKLELNDAEVSLAEAVVPNTTWGFNEGEIGKVTVKAGENVIKVTALADGMPALDYFLLVPLA